jgi:Zn-finger nucleic acid-binding protein
MECPNCKNKINLEKEENIEENCPHCGFYFYLRHALRIACSAYWQIDINEDFYFKNIHQRIYNPFIYKQEDKIEPIKGTISIGEYLINQL